LLSQSLQPRIGLSALPADGDSVCAIPVYTGSFQGSGFQAGDTIPAFRLYDSNGSETEVEDLLQTGKPLLLIAGSYTCPVFRQKITQINQVASTFAGLINVVVIYVVEPHPKAPDLSPYSGSVWTTSENQQEGILYLQPTIYGERKQLLQDMQSNPNYVLDVPVMIDGPCNDWWQHFGPAPNNAYLIQSDGVIFRKHDWFNRNPNKIVDDVNALLVITSDHDLLNIPPNVYPVPAETTLTFDFAGHPFPVEINVYDLSGKEIFKAGPIHENQYHLNIERLNTGIYFYKTTGVYSSSRGKFIVR
jgi:hypothetical protein